MSKTKKTEQKHPSAKRRGLRKWKLTVPTIYSPHGFITATLTKQKNSFTITYDKFCGTYEKLELHKWLRKTIGL
jgi:hypothetical protein